MGKSKRMKGILTLVLIAMLLVSGCSSGTSTSSTPAPETNNSTENKEDSNSSSSGSASTIQVGVLLPLSGGMAVTGEMMRHGIELATEQYNAAGNLPNGAQVELNVFDDRATPSEGVTAAQRLVNDENISAVLGPYNSSVALAVKEIFTDGELPFVSTGTAADAMTEDNFDWYFRPHAYNAYQAEAFADFISNKLEKKKVAVFYENTDYGEGLSSNVIPLLEEKGTEIILKEGYNPGNRDFSSALTKIMSQNPEAIVTIALGTEAAIIAKQAMESGIPGDKIIGVGGFDHPDFYNLSAGGAEDIHFMFWFDPNNPLVPEGRTFADAFMEKFGTEPDSSAAQAYTAAKALYEAMIRAGKTDREAIRDALVETDMSSPIGHITFDENHNAQAGISFARWKDGEKDFLKFD